MGDPGFISGMIGLAIHLGASQVVQYINIAIRCRKELDALKVLLLKLQSMNMEMQQCRKSLNSGRLSTAPHNPLPSTVNNWLTELNALLEQASDLAQSCTVRSYAHLFSRYRTSRKIRRLVEKVEKHLAYTPCVAFLHQLHQHVANQQVLEQNNQCTSALARTSGDLFPSTSSASPKTKYIEEALVVGQDSALNGLVELIHSQQHKKVSRFGIFGKGGAGKTLLLKRVFNSDQVQSLFCNDLMLWLTVSQNPSFNSLRNDLVKQIALKVSERLDSREEEGVKTWLNESMKKYKFALFIDDVWETSASRLLEELCVPHSPNHNYNIIIATSRCKSALSQLGVPPPSIIHMQDLTEDDSWRLFSSRAFLHSDGVLPMSIDREIARHVCDECGGLPLAIKAVGQAMAGITQSNEWELAVERLQNDVTNSLYGKLRLSYDALADVAGCGISLQLCFLYLAAFPEDNIISFRNATAYWIGEGLVAGPDPIRIGEMYINLLADRCLIEPVKKNNEGKVLCFRVHNVLSDLAHQIALKEEKCFFQAGRGLRKFPEGVSSGYVRISLIDNSLSSVPKTIRAPYIRCLLLAGNTSLVEISKEVIGSMTSLRLLDMSRTAIQSLPRNIGCLKHLVCLKLCYVPIKRLPNSVAALKGLEILDLKGSDITQLPAGISKLTSLKLLDLSFCDHLQYMTYGIAQLTSLEYLNAINCPNIRWEKCRGNRLSINDLGTLNQLRRLAFQNNGEIFREGILGIMKQMEYLCFHLTDMESLPHDMIAMSKLRELYLICPHLVQIGYSITEFRHLSCIMLIQCNMLKQLPALHKLPNLKHLDIVNCPSIKKFPEEFGMCGAFPKLEVFSVVKAEKLEQLPIVEEGALPSLKILTIMKCEALQRIPQCYWNLKSVEKIRVYGCSNVQLFMAEEENFIRTRPKVQTIRISTTEIEALEERYFDIRCGDRHFYYGEFWRNEVFQFLELVFGFNIERNGI